MESGQVSDMMFSLILCHYFWNIAFAIQMLVEWRGYASVHNCNAHTAIFVLPTYLVLE